MFPHAYNFLFFASNHSHIRSFTVTKEPPVLFKEPSRRINSFRFYTTYSSTSSLNGGVCDRSVSPTKENPKI